MVKLYLYFFILCLLYLAAKNVVYTWIPDEIELPAILVLKVLLALMVVVLAAFKLKRPQHG